jgi:hypothetical protein
MTQPLDRRAQGMELTRLANATVRDALANGSTATQVERESARLINQFEPSFFGATLAEQYRRVLAELRK